MTRKRRVKRQWTEPVVLVPIIAAVISAIIGPNLGAISQYIQDLTKKPPEYGPPIDGSGLNVSTDKGTYGFGDWVKVTGSVEKPAQGKTVRLDVYDPKGEVFGTMNASVGRTIPQSDIQIKPNDKGLFNYRFPLDPFYREKGTHKIEVTYDGIARNTTFTIR